MEKISVKIEYNIEYASTHLPTKKVYNNNSILKRVVRRKKHGDNDKNQHSSQYPLEKNIADSGRHDGSEDGPGKSEQGGLPAEFKIVELPFSEGSNGENVLE